MRNLTWLYRTKASFKGHLIAGTILFFLPMPIGAIDIILAPEWYALHPSCDSLAIPVFGVLFASPIWLVMSAVLTAVLCYFCVKGREGGKHILDFPFKPSLSSVFWNVALLLVIVNFLLTGIDHLMNSGSEFTTTVDCDGKAETLTVTRVWPWLQIGPVIQVFIAIWLLHLRSLVSTPYTPAPDRKT